MRVRLRVHHGACASPAASAIIITSHISIGGGAPPLPLLGSIKPMPAVGRCFFRPRRGGAPPHRPSRCTLAGGPERRGRSLVRRRLGLSSDSSSSMTMTTVTTRTTSGRPPAGRRRIFRIRAADDGASGGRAGRLARLSNMNLRLSAALEDHLLTTMNSETTTTKRGGDGRRMDDHDYDSHDQRLVDPILSRRSITRAGLDWVRGNRVINIDDDNEEYDDKDSIVVTIRPPTMLHPRLDELAAGVADFVREGAASWIEESGWSDFLPGEDEAQSHRIGVTVDVYPMFVVIIGGVGVGVNVALRDVSHVLAVYSCKGGVGKSTVAVNLAYRLSASGGRIGLVDLDVYGPSLPLLVRPDDPTRVLGSSRGGGAAVMRGPMAGKVVRQLRHGTNWGSLDVLVLDLPPGTGDVQLEACQPLSLSGAVAGVDMGVPTLGVVENMSYFVCEGGGRHYPFGKSRNWDDEGGSSPSAAAAAASHYLPGLTRSRIPLCCDGSPGGLYNGTTDVRGEPAIDRSRDDDVRGHDRRGRRIQFFDTPFTGLSVDGASGNLIKVVAGIELRHRDSRTGEEEEEAGGPTMTAREGAPTMQGGVGCGGGGDWGGSSSMVRHHTSRDIGPNAASHEDGNYGYEVEWGDGSKIIYSLLAIAKAAGGGRKAPPWIVGEQRR
ncbi:hypothetical protein ACHAW5_010583 [Stephanodiscus triporus]|uniref:Uncharacterized protein n=1 Tax=Stephanodiscus triporus TaxID=2934178 RepID=A0ABD3QVG1_9STRA